MKAIILSGFAALLYLKAALDYLFSEDVTIIAALLMSGAFACSALLAANLYTARFASLAVARISWGTLLMRGFPAFLYACVGYTIVCRLIVYGFSKNLNGEIFNEWYHQENITHFALIVLMPVAAHYAASIYTYKMSRNSTKNQKITRAQFYVIAQQFKDFIQSKFPDFDKALSVTNLTSVSLDIAAWYETISAKMAYMTSMLAAQKENTQFRKTELYQEIKLMALDRVTSTLQKTVHKSSINPALVAVKQLVQCDDAIQQVMNNFIEGKPYPLDPIFELINKEIPIVSEEQSPETRNRVYGDIFRKMASTLTN